MHTTIQAYLTEMYGTSIVAAEALNLEDMLKTEMVKEFTQIREKHNVDVCNQKDLTEFYEDGVAIIEHFKKHRGKYFMKKKSNKNDKNNNESSTSISYSSRVDGTRGIIEKQSKTAGLNL